ncbi:4-(cytidine 5'-diphospho)-2-C-methyl-D-erythritol kinase [Niabella ginsengisoli]|uniref:GHMP kinase C-terminal domain-containing protein n=1 Tax=Niabella ginsengisoli TaxID=522298 RepID=A0ABS9SGZ3_9BACT|nr:hypothetical protein [Niabella ginsengisoli]MCH5597642.1 hypothetical protein [Niabella ginsengisoli]
MPFFIVNMPVIARGRGEIFEKVPVDLSGYQIIIINPGIHISTPWAFGQLKPAHPTHDLQTSIQKPIIEWKEFIFNDFEPVVFNAYPEIAAVKNQLYQAGAVFAALSGSGSTVYGLFEKDTNVNLNLSSNYFTKRIIP